MSFEQNKDTVRQFYKEAFEQGDLMVIDALFAADYVSHDPSAPGGQWPRGSEGVKQIIMTYRGAFPDIKFDIDDQIADGDLVVTRWTSRGTNTGSLMGMPSTGRQATITGISIERLSGGKIVETWVNFDLLGLLQQIGVVSMPH